MIYTFDSRVRYSEVDHQGTLTLPAMMNYLQDCSTFQSEDIGVGLSALRERKREIGRASCRGRVLVTV